MVRRNEEITVFLELKPHPQERIRFHFSGWGKRRKISPYLPEKTREFQDGIRSMIREYMASEDISEFPKGTALYLDAIFYLPRPKSAAKRAYPTVRPDLSNYFKALEDGLQREAKDGSPALIEDDAGVCRISCEKRYVDDEYPEPGILVTIGEYDE